MLHHFTRFAAVALVAGWLTCLSPANLAAAEQAVVRNTLDEAMQELAKEVHDFIGTVPAANNRLRVDAFTGPSSSGIGLVDCLKRNLKTAGVAMADVGGFSISGNFEIAADPQVPDQSVVRINTSVNKPLGGQLHEFPKVIVTKTDEVLKMLGQTVNATPTGAADVAADVASNALQALDPAAASQAIVRGAENPQTPASLGTPPPAGVVPAGQPGGPTLSLARFAPNSPFGVEVLIRRPGGLAPCAFNPVDLKAGVARVALAEGDVYVLKIHNSSGLPVGAAVAIDGINVFSFSKNVEWNRLGKMVIMPGAAMVNGWHDDGDFSFAFQVSHYGDSAAAHFGADKGVGTINVIFYQTGRGMGVGDGQIGTKIGERIVVPYGRAVTHFLQPLGSVAIHYNRAGHPGDLPQ